MPRVRTLTAGLRLSHSTSGTGELPQPIARPPRRPRLRHLPRALIGHHRVLEACLATWVILGLPATAAAHDPGLSVLEIRATPTHLVADLALAASDAEDARSRDSGDLMAFAMRALDVSVDGRRLRGSAGEERLDDDGVRIRVLFDRPTGSSLAVRSTVPRLLSRGHRQLLSVRDADGTLIAERMLDAGAPDHAIDLRTAASVNARAAAFFRLGVEHILGGYDHLLFLAALLVVVSSLRDVVKTVTAFTIAHSLTLALTTVVALEVPAAIVEPLIAASIVYVAVDNLLRREARSRAGLTFAFGLIHGFGFASALRDLLGAGSADAGIAIPLASFNLGVEAGQVAVAMAIVPMVSWLRARSPIGSAWMSAAGSLCVLLAGGYWLAERTLGSL